MSRIRCLPNRQDIAIVARGSLLVPLCMVASVWMEEAMAEASACHSIKDADERATAWVWYGRAMTTGTASRMAISAAGASRKPRGHGIAATYTMKTFSELVWLWPHMAYYFAFAFRAGSSKTHSSRVGDGVRVVQRRGMSAAPDDNQP